ncbi:aprataxin and PNK-like factor [Palaemon carinicauda]|uniref:aprataxin and PNK-like factor n=1 Tax=Palaemon carinicauda TaxID=392227 RepID=UPI0035B592FF
MSITLIRVEAPGEKWEEERNEPEITSTLPLVLGRGSLLKCGDKKVSRRQAYLDWDDDGVMLTSVHQNPTYVSVKGVTKEITEGDALFLSHGDKFGLQKEKFWYMINLPSVCKEEEKNGTETRNQEASDDKNQDISKSDAGDSKPTPMDEQNRCKIAEDTSCNEDFAKNSKIKDSTTKTCDEKDTSIHRITKDLISKNEVSADGNSRHSRKNDLSVKVDADKTDDTEKSPGTISAKEIQMAVSNKQRNLPEWLKNTEALKKSPPEKENQASTSHGGVRKIQTSSTKSKVSKKLKNSDNASSVSLKTDVSSVNNRNKGKGEDMIPSGNDEHSKQQTVQKGVHTPSKNRTATNTSPKRRTPTKNKSSPLKNNTKGLHAISDEDSEYDSGNEPDEELQTKVSAKDGTNKKGKATSKHQLGVKPVMRDEEEESASGEEENKPSASSPASTPNSARGGTSPAFKKKPRRPCQYGAKCYRKNPKHIAGFAHVGDSDYYESSSDPEASDDDRPQCEYGVTCYRKNPQHRKDYRHSRKPQPQRRAKRKARQQKQGGDSDSDDYDYDDPFLDDGSSDDYAPTESDSEFHMEEED